MTKSPPDALPEIAKPIANPSTAKRATTIRDKEERVPAVLSDLVVEGFGHRGLERGLSRATPLS